MAEVLIALLGFLTLGGVITGLAAMIAMIRSPYDGH